MMRQHRCVNHKSNSFSSCCEASRESRRRQRRYQSKWHLHRFYMCFYQSCTKWAMRVYVYHSVQYRLYKLSQGEQSVTHCSLLKVHWKEKPHAFWIFVGIFLLYPTCIKPRPQSWATHRIRLTLYFVSLIHHFFVILDSLGIYVLWITKKELKLSANRNKFVSGINLGRK